MLQRMKISPWVFAVLLLAGCAKRELSAPLQTGRVETEPMPPPTRREEVVEILQGERWVDPYRWLEDGTSPEVVSWSRAQNAATRALLNRSPARPRLVKRLESLLYVESASAPVKRGGRLFYLKTRPELEKAILCWRDQDGAGPERVLLDPNHWAPGDRTSLGIWVPSPSGKRLAFSTKPNAADEATLHVLEVDTGRWSTLDDIPGAKYAEPKWTPDETAFYYEWLPTDPAIPVAERPGYTEVRRHRLGVPSAQDVKVHPRTGDPATFLQSQLSRDGRYLFVSILHGWSENELFWMRLGKDQRFRPLVSGKGKGIRYEVTAWGDRFFLFTDEGASRGRVFEVSPGHPERGAWKERVPEDPAATLREVSILGGRLALLYLKDASTEIRLAALDGSGVRVLAIPPFSAVNPGIEGEGSLVGREDDDTFFFQLSNFTQPRQILRASASKATVQLDEHSPQLKLPFDPSPYVSEQLFFSSKDGTRIPIFLVHRKDWKRDGHNPVLLTGYGGFNLSLTPDFRPTLVPGLEAGGGGVFALVNLRGGGEYGATWHEAGRRERKQNVFDDFLAAAQWLVDQKITQPKRLAITGRSNGGLLVGAVMTQRPELFGAVVCGVPLLDMLRYHRFGSGMTWTPEYGSADGSPEEFKYLRAYSPYQALLLRAGQLYPPLLMMAADRDDRVDPMHARKFVAALQASSNTAYLRVEANAGHRGADRVRQTVEASSDEYTFLFQQLGLSPIGGREEAAASGSVL